LNQNTDDWPKNNYHIDCGLCQNTYISRFQGDVICPQCENTLRDNSDWITGIFQLYRDNDFEILMELIPRIRQQMKIRALQLCQLAVESYKKEDLMNAIFLWQEARSYDYKNIQAAFNLAYVYWKNGDITYEDFISSLRGFKHSRSNYNEYREYISHIEYALSQSKDLEGFLPLSAGRRYTKRVRQQPAVKHIRTLLTHRGKISTACFSPSGNHILTGGLDGRISLWNSKNGLEEQRFSFPYNQVTSTCFTPDGFYVFAATDDYRLHLLELTSGNKIREFSGHRALPIWVGVTPYGRMALSGGWDGTIGFWDLQKSKPMNLYRANLGPINSMWMSSDGMCLLLTGLKKEFRMFDLSGEMKHRCLGLPDRWPTCVASTDTSSYVLCGNSDGSIVLWNLNPGKAIKILSGHRGTVICLAVTDNFRYAFSAGIDKTVRIWDINLGVEIYRLEEESRRVYSLSLTADNHYLLTAGEDGQVKVWEYWQ
jgi:WD40 repeat protein